MSFPAVLILAAGSSSRMGEPKQLLRYKGASLLRRMTGVALSIKQSGVTVVLGANADMLKKELEDLPVHCVINEDWKGGMASSISCGISRIEQLERATEAVIMMVCDQPHVTAQLLEELINKRAETGKDIVACSYSNTVGVPALFGKTLFNQLQSLKGSEGAKKIILNNRDVLATIPFEKGNVDIDTPEDWNKLKEDFS